jgi:hypothetical protein
MSKIAALLQAEIREARAPGARRHDATIIQEWCDRSQETWDDSFGRIRLWIRRHPVFTITWLLAVAIVSYLSSTNAMR